MDAINGSMATLKGDLATLRPLIKTLKENALNAYPTESLSNQAVASFTDGAKNIPVKSLSVAITPVQSGTGDPSPDNIRPISGHTEVNVVRTGKNLLSGIYAGQISSTTGQESTGTLPICAPIKVKPSTAYTLSPTATNGAVRFFEYDANGNFIKTATASGTAITGGYKVTYTTSATTAYLRFQSTATIIPFDGSYQLEEGSTATTYETFGQTYTISLGQTVYGGTLNVKTGVLTIDRAMEDLGTLTWYMSSNSSYGQFFYSAISGKATGTTNVLSDRYETNARANWTADTDYAIAGNSSSSQIYIKDSRYSSASTFKTAMNGIYVCYELATPITVQLTPTEVTTLLGTNNIWADTGDITEVTIRCDTALYIAKLVG